MVTKIVQRPRLVDGFMMLFAVQLMVIQSSGSQINLSKDIRRNPSNDGARIVNGGEVVPGEFPFLANVHSDGKPVCGATLLSSSTLFTACHCLVKDPYALWTHADQELQDPEKIEVIAGSIHNDVEYYHEGSSRVAKAIKIHPKCEKTVAVMAYDYGVIETKDPFTLAKGAIEVFHISMADKGRITETIMKPNSVKCVAMGWGAIEEGTLPVAFLNKINMTLKPLDWCLKTAKELTKDLPVPNEFNPDFQTCALGTGNNETVCGGDSGGPILCGEGKKIIVAVLTGIVTKQCGDDKNPALLARLDFALEWILSAFPPTTSGTTINPTFPPAHSSVSYVTISFAHAFPLMFCLLQNIRRYLQ